ncbi:MAG TPA: hypothetical protein PLE67_12545 [Tenuifilaceae bacterium]|nr:hypothetical protein [Tenuifilaceae bacterium]HPQ35491.1 hypothetical protein [Tenuifilaceae bacterium]HRX66895.1 hypothetical protein [Tenuifilaceae bacterium]
MKLSLKKIKKFLSVLFICQLLFLLPNILLAQTYPVQGEMELNQMAKYSNGEQWEYMLEDIKYGDLFALKEEENYIQYAIDRRIAKYIIEKWKDSHIPEVQDLIAAFKSVM